MSPRRINDAAQFAGWISVVGAAVLELATNSFQSFVGKWVTLAVLVAGIVVLLTLWLIRHSRTPPPPVEAWPPQPLPLVGELVGRDHEVEMAVAGARSRGVVVVHGPDGIGDSSVAITAAGRLVPDASRQRYVDLRKLRPTNPLMTRIPLLRERTRWVRMPVLRTLGLDLRLSEDEATQAVEARLRRSGLVLVVDNVVAANEVQWVARGVRGAYIVIAGKVSGEELPEAADVPVPGLKPADALELLRRSDAEPAPGRLRMLWDLVVGGGPRHAHGHALGARIVAEERVAWTLAERYLWHPRVVIQLGRWLAQNPAAKLSDLLRSLDVGGDVFELQTIMNSTVEGMAAGARRLLSLLDTAPDVALPDAAVAALANISVEEASRHLTDLGRRFLVHRTLFGSRPTEQAAHFIDEVPPRKAAKAHARLAAYYAGPAARGGELLFGEQHQQAAAWFADEDVTLLGVLEVPDPPRRAASSLWAIADALDLWFASEDRGGDRSDVAKAMAARAKELGDTAAEAIALIRRAAVARAEGRGDRASELLVRVEAMTQGRAPWRPQLRTEWALNHAAGGDLDAAHNDILEAIRTRPRRDLEGRRIDMANLAAIQLRERQPGGPAGETAGAGEVVTLTGVPPAGNGSAVPPLRRSFFSRTGKR